VWELGYFDVRSDRTGRRFLATNHCGVTLAVHGSDRLVAHAELGRHIPRGPVRGERANGFTYHRRQPSGTVSVVRRPAGRPGVSPRARLGNDHHTFEARGKRRIDPRCVRRHNLFRWDWQRPAEGTTPIRPWHNNHVRSVPHDRFDEESPGNFVPLRRRRDLPGARESKRIDNQAPVNVCRPLTATPSPRKVLCNDYRLS